MVPIPGRRKYVLNKISIDAVKEAISKSIDNHGPEDRWTLKLEAFLNFLERLDWSKTAIYYEENIHEGGGNSGWKVVHFIHQVEEQWHNICGMTWFGISAYML